MLWFLKGHAWKIVGCFIESNRIESNRIESNRIGSGNSQVRQSHTDQTSDRPGTCRQAGRHACMHAGKARQRLSCWLMADRIMSCRQFKAGHCAWPVAVWLLFCFTNRVESSRVESSRVSVRSFTALYTTASAAIAVRSHSQWHRDLVLSVSRSWVDRHCSV